MGKRLGEVIARRRGEMRMTQAEISQASDVSLATWNLLERGRQSRFRPFTLRKASVALGFPDDALERIAEGEDPELVLSNVRSGTARFVAGGTLTAIGRGEPQPTPDPDRMLKQGPMPPSMRDLIPRWDELDEEQQRLVRGAMQGMVNSILDTRARE